MVEENMNGSVLEGYEYQRHEIWYHIKEWPIDSFSMDPSAAGDYYQNLDFSLMEDFVKLADVHTFFRSEFTLTDSTILRTGKVVGRDLEKLTNAELKEALGDAKRANEVEIELGRIISNRLKDFSLPINCQPTPLIDKNVANIKDGDVMEYNCQMTTSRRSINYTKGYRLFDQYIKNDCIEKSGS